jgi:aminopeptidase N
MWRRQLTSGRTAIGRSLASQAVSRWGGERAVADLEAAARRERFWGAQAEIVQSLGGVKGEKAVASLRRLLGALKHPKARRAVVEQLGRRGGAADARTLAPLARADKSLLVRAEATRALGALDFERHRPLIEKNLKAATYRDGVAAAAVAAIAASKDASAARVLLATAQSPARFGARVAAIRALGEYASADAGAVPALCGMLGENDERVSLVACATLGRTADERALPALEKAAKSAGNPRIRVYATESIARIKAGAKTKSKLPGRSA